MFTNPMKRKIIYLILAYALLIMSNLWVKNYFTSHKEKEYTDMRDYGSYYESNGIYQFNSTYNLNLDSGGCIRVAKRIEQLYNTVGPDSCRKFVQQQTNVHVFDRRMAWFSSHYERVKEKDIKFDLIDSMAIVMTP